MPVSEDARSIEVSLRPWWSSLAADVVRHVRPVATLGLAALAAIMATSELWPAAVVVGASSLALLGLHVASRTAGRATTLVLDRDAVTVGGARVPRDELGAGTIERGVDHHVVRVARAFRPPLRFEVASVEAGRQLIARLGADLSRRPLVTWVGSRFRGPVVTVAALAWFVAAYVPNLVGTWTFSWVTVMAGILALRAAPSRLRIGADAIEQRWLTAVRRWAVGDLVSVEHLLPTLGQGHRLRLVLRDGSAVEIPLSSGAAPDARAHDLARTLIERIERAMREVPAPGPAAFAEWNETLARGTADSWLAALHGEGDDYRAAAAERFTLGDLWRTLRDARARPVDRVAAAIVLARDAGHRADLEIVAAASVLPEVGGAIRLALARDDAGLAALLARTAPTRTRVRVEVTDEAREDEEAAERHRRTR